MELCLGSSGTIDVFAEGTVERWADENPDVLQHLAALMSMQPNVGHRYHTWIIDEDDEGAAKVIELYLDGEDMIIAYGLMAEDGRLDDMVDFMVQGVLER